MHAYRRFGFIYTLWFIQMPFLVLIARTIPSYMQAKTLFGTERCLNPKPCRVTPQRANAQRASHVPILDSIVACAWHVPILDTMCMPCARPCHQHMCASLPPTHVRILDTNQPIRFRV